MLPAPIVRGFRQHLGFRLSCSAIGISPINMVIIRNSKTLVNTTNTASVQVEKFGNHMCRATSKYGTDERQFVVINGEDIQIISFKVFPSIGKKKQSFRTSHIYCMYHLTEIS